MPYAYGLLKYASLTQYIQHNPRNHSHNFSLDTYYAASPALGKIYKKLYESSEKDESPPILSEQEELCIQQEMPIDIAHSMKFFGVHCLMSYKKRTQKILHDNLTNAIKITFPIMVFASAISLSKGGTVLHTVSRPETLAICHVDDPFTTYIGYLLLLIGWVPHMINGICDTIKILDSWQEPKNKVMYKSIGSIKQLST